MHPNPIAQRLESNISMILVYRVREGIDVDSMPACAKLEEQPVNVLFQFCAHLQLFDAQFNRCEGGQFPRSEKTKKPLPPARRSLPLPAWSMALPPIG